MYLIKKLSKQWNVPHNLPMKFSERFCLFMFEALQIQMKFNYLMNRFEYYLITYINPKNKFKLKPCATYFIDNCAQSHMDTVAVTSECVPSPHQIAPS